MLGYPSRSVEWICTFLDQAIVMYTAFAGGVGCGMGVLCVLWWSRLGVCNAWVHHAWLEVWWTVLPVVFLLWSVIHSVSVLYAYEERGCCSSVCKVVGHQWYWEYVQANGLGCESRMVGSSALADGALRLTFVDQPLYLVRDLNVGVCVSSADVIHSWSVPSLGVKLDAIPGRVSMVSLSGLCSGVHSGYCTELCGSGHGFMPIQVVVY